MDYYTYKVELNGKKVIAKLDADFWYEMFQGGTNVSEDVVKQTAQQIYDAVKKEDDKDTRYAVRITAEFKDDYLKGIIDADYSEDFVPVDEPHYYDSEYTNKFIEEQRRELLKESICKAIYENDYSDFDALQSDEPVDEYPYDLKGSIVEYDRDEVERDILNEYKDFYNGLNEYFYENLVDEKLNEMGFDELCEQKGVEVEIDYDYGSLNVSYYDGIFHFETYVILNFYEIYDDE